MYRYLIIILIAATALPLFKLVFSSHSRRVLITKVSYALLRFYLNCIILYFLYGSSFHSRLYSQSIGSVQEGWRRNIVMALIDLFCCLIIGYLMYKFNNFIITKTYEYLFEVSAFPLSLKALQEKATGDTCFWRFGLYSYLNICLLPVKGYSFDSYKNQNKGSLGLRGGQKLK